MIQNYGPSGAIVLGLLWLIYQYFRNRYYANDTIKTETKEIPVVAAIAEDTQKASTDTQTLEQAEEALKDAIKNDATNTSGNSSGK